MRQTILYNGLALRAVSPRARSEIAQEGDIYRDGGMLKARLNGVNFTVAFLDREQTFSGKTGFVPKAPGEAPLNIAPRDVPAAPVDGDVWLTSSGMFARINGATVALGGSQQQTFETVSKNLAGQASTLGYDGSGNLTTITYASGIVKTLAYGPDGLASITLSGAVPGGISLVKTLIYTGGRLTGAAYS